MAETYDVIVVGAGGAGAPLAARLTEDEGRTVLLLEAGKDHHRTEDFPKELQNGSTLQSMVPGNPADWGFKGQLTKDLNIVVNRGKVLGGSTSLNGTYFVRARKSDFDEWSQHGNDEWKYENVLPFYKKSETDQDYGETAVHGGSGPMLVHRSKQDGPLIEAFHAAARSLGYPEEKDWNDQEEPGYGAIPVNAPDGLRWNTGIAYINPIRATRKNLTVQGETFVRRVIFEGTTAVGVEVEHGGSVSVIHGGEIVLAAGSVKSPHILLLSGVGPKAELTALNVEVVHDSPGVGKGMSDHPDVLLSWQPKYDLADYDRKEQLPVGLHVTAEGSPFPGDLEIMTSDKPMGYLMSGRRSPYMSTFGAVMANPFATLKAMFGTSLKRYISQAVHAVDNTFNMLLQKQVSRGELKLVSADPKVYPLLDYRYFSEEFDRVRMRQAARVSVDMLHSQAFTPIFKKLTEIDTATLNDDKALDRWIGQHLITGIHMAGTAKFGDPADPMTVTDQYGKVLGVQNLRVADPSILPSITSRGPAATAVMMGELMADFIRRGK